MTKFSAKHKQDLQFILQKFNKYVIGEKCTAVEVAETVARIMEMHGLETCDCKKVDASPSDVRAQKAQKLNRMKTVEKTVENGQKEPVVAENGQSDD